MSAMVNFSVPWINIMSKMDLVSGDARNGVKGKRDVARFLDPDPYLEYHPLCRRPDLRGGESLEAVLSHIDYTMQYGEDEEPREPKDMDQGDFVDME
ncbi:ATP(GTP)-binding protein Fet5 [Ceratobasidium sp. AG-Ba]|nr:ATP(GTP)-binding protein Fet5 [Ceratobasidium sp. AG-Ba]